MNTRAVRQRIAYEAARILLDQGGEPDYFGATRKAAERLGVRNSRDFPKSSEVRQALLDQQSLFSSQPREDTIRQPLSLPVSHLQRPQRAGARQARGIMNRELDQLRALHRCRLRESTL